MKYLFVVSHPAHVHLFKNTINHLKSCNHQIMVVAVDKDVTIALLEENGIDFFRISGHGKTLSSKFLTLILQEKLFFNMVRNFNPDLIIARCQPFAFHCAKILGIKSISFADTEHARINYYLCYPFADKIVTPSCFQGNFGRRHERFDSYFELSYLHPNVFKPDPSILDLLGVEKGEKYVVLRFVSWNAVHDIGHGGFSLQMKKEMVKVFSKSVKVFITSESHLPKDLEKYRIQIPPEKMHDALYYSSLYIGEGAKMASECAVLGTPAIYVNTLSAGTLEEQASKYGLIVHCKDSSKIIDTALSLLRNSNLKLIWNKKREKMVSEKIDLTDYMCELIDNIFEPNLQNTNVFQK